MDLQTILLEHRKKTHTESEQGTTLPKIVEPTFAQIPDVFFDEVLPHYKLTRIEVMALIYIYRAVWCKPNLYKLHGISPLLSYSQIAFALGVHADDICHSLRKLEEYQFISTIRSGQYFVRRFFLKEIDERFGQNYDDFEA